MLMEILGEALKQGIAPAVVIAIYLVVVKVIDSKREESQVNLTKDFINAIIKMSNFLDDVTDDIVQKNNERTQAAIKTIFKSSANSIIKFATNIVISNHIEANKTGILENIESFINAEYYTLYSNLLMYNTNGNKVTDYLKEDWKDAIKNGIIDIIYNKDFTDDQKLYNINNRVNIKIEDYSVYVTNKFIENVKR